MAGPVGGGGGGDGKWPGQRGRQTRRGHRMGCSVQRIAYPVKDHQEAQPSLFQCRIYWLPFRVIRWNCSSTRTL